MNDMISRNAAINALAEMYCKSDEDGYVWIIRGDAWKRIDALPSAEKQGKWIEHEWAEEYDRILISNYECSECKSWEREKTNYCPNCGARMKGE